MVSRIDAMEQKLDSSIRKATEATETSFPQTHNHDTDDKFHRMDLQFESLAEQSGKHLAAIKKLRTQIGALEQSWHDSEQASLEPKIFAIEAKLDMLETRLPQTATWRPVIDDTRTKMKATEDKLNDAVKLIGKHSQKFDDTVAKLTTRIKTLESESRKQTTEPACNNVEVCLKKLQDELRGRLRDMQDEQSLHRTETNQTLEPLSNYTVNMNTQKEVNQRVHDNIQEIRVILSTSRDELNELHQNTQQAISGWQKEQERQDGKLTAIARFLGIDLVPPTGKGKDKSKDCYNDNAATVQGKGNRR